MYPAWRQWKQLEKNMVVEVDRVTDNGKSKPEVIDAVFVCRSGAWTPPWLDEAFKSFVESCPVERWADLQDTTPREFDETEVAAYVRGLQKMKGGETKKVA